MEFISINLDIPEECKKALADECLDHLLVAIRVMAEMPEYDRLKEKLERAALAVAKAADARNAALTT